MLSRLSLVGMRFFTPIFSVVVRLLFDENRSIIDQRVSMSFLLSSDVAKE